MKKILLAGIFAICLQNVVPAQSRYAIVISEIMADPTPSAGLPAAEWIELYNRSTTVINLQGWRMGDASGQSGPLPNYNLLPGAYLLLCSSGNLPQMSTYGAAIGVSSFPSLDNDGDLLVLRNAAGQTMHAVRYSIDWYHNPVKQDGGWSLEMINTNEPCESNTNWTASTATQGGTPGRINAVTNNTSAATPPALLRSYSTDAQTINLVWNKPLDSMAAAIAARYQLNNGITVLQATAIPPLFDEVQLRLQQPLQAQTVYSVAVSAVSDCNGRIVAPNSAVPAGLAEELLPADCILNELLFNPRPDGDDYVEVFNNSKKIANAAHLFIANRNAAGALTTVKPLSATPWLLFPGSFLVVTADTASIQRQYHVKYPERVLPLPGLPSFPDDAGTVVLLNNNGQVLDEVTYRDDWHFPLLTDPEGVSLEKLDPSLPSAKADSWHSAATTAGYGTPGYTNSQAKQTIEASAIVTVDPPVISPDNDGHDDFARIHCTPGEAGYTAQVFIYDRAGRIVRRLVPLALAGNNNSWTWDGLGEQGEPLPAGIYIIYIQLVRPEGKKKISKTTIVLARR